MSWTGPTEERKGLVLVDPERLARMLRLTQEGIPMSELVDRTKEAPGAAVVFLDTETTGLDAELDQPWEMAWCRRDFKRGEETVGRVFIEHDESRAELLPEPFRSDYQTRYRPEEAITRDDAAQLLDGLFEKGDHLVGAVPSFEDLRLGYLMMENGFTRSWHYHLQCVESIALGFLTACMVLDKSLWRTRDDFEITRKCITKLPIDSDALSRVLGVEPTAYARHTAMGDVMWCRAMWDIMFPPETARNGSLIPGLGPVKDHHHTSIKMRDLTN